jgi:hypothetical protein
VCRIASQYVQFFVPEGLNRLLVAAMARNPTLFFLDTLLAHGHNQHPLTLLGVRL